MIIRPAARRSVLDSQKMTRNGTVIILMEQTQANTIKQTVQTVVDLRMSTNSARRLDSRMDRYRPKILKIT
jgi:hypothetical protein